MTPLLHNRSTMVSAHSAVSEMPYLFSLCVWIELLSVALGVERSRYSARGQETQSDSNHGSRLFLSSPSSRNVLIPREAWHVCLCFQAVLSIYCSEDSLLCERADKKTNKWKMGAVCSCYSSACSAGCTENTIFIQNLMDVIYLFFFFLDDSWGQNNLHLSGIKYLQRCRCTNAWQIW